jgi:TonB family protein
MKILLALFLFLPPLYSPFARGPRSSGAITPTQTAAVKPTPKPTPGPTRNQETTAQSSPQTTKPVPTAAELLLQGKSLYRLARFKQALVKFEEALKQEPKNDEALGLAAVTAFRLDNQAQSREYFLRRIELSDQKDSVKAYCYYRIALTYWRDAHDAVAMYVDIVDGRIVHKLPEAVAADAARSISNGLEYADRALAITNNIPDAYNIKNLLHAETALAEADEAKAEEQRKLSTEFLRRAIELDEMSAGANRGDAADFSFPTIRIAEYAKTREEEARLDDPMMKMISGGRPIKRVKAVFNTLRRPKPANDGKEPSSDAGRGAQSPANMPESVKVEVLVSTTGDVVFAHVVNGRPELNNAAIIAARNWKFEPARFDGRPVQVSGVITFEIKPGQR